MLYKINEQSVCLEHIFWNELKAKELLRVRERAIGNNYNDLKFTIQRRWGIKKTEFFVFYAVFAELIGT